MSSSSPSGATGLVEELLDALARWVPALLPDPARAGAIVQACRAAGAQLDPAVEPSDAVALIERAAQVHSRHLLLFVDPSGSRTPDTEDRGWPPPDLRAVRRRAGGVRSVDRADNGIATIRVDSLEPFDVAEPYLEAAVALAARATGVILDLRANGGGDPATVAYLAGFVLGPQPRTLSEVHHRDGVTSWSTAGPAGGCLAGDVPVAVLTSDATFSSAEALAYHLQVRGRVSVVGAATPGAADHVTPFTLTPHVHAQLPVASVVDTETGASWEGVGVRPDLACPAADAPSRASEWIRHRLAAG